MSMLTINHNHNYHDQDKYLQKASLDKNFPFCMIGGNLNDSCKSKMLNKLIDFFFTEFVKSFSFIDRGILLDPVTLIHKSKNV